MALERVTSLSRHPHDLNWNHKDISVERSAQVLIQMSGLIILVKGRDGNNGSDEIRSPSHLLSRCSLNPTWTVGAFHTSSEGGLPRNPPILITIFSNPWSPTTFLMKPVLSFASYVQWPWVLTLVLLQSIKNWPASLFSEPAGLGAVEAWLLLQC